MIKFYTSRLKDGPLELEGREKSDFLGVEDTKLMHFDGDVGYSLVATAVSGGVLVKGRVWTTCHGTCGRCLKNFEREYANDDICRYYEDVTDMELDISGDIREDLLVNIPYNPLCSDDCRGLCPGCGADLNAGKCGCGGGDDNGGAWKELDKLKF